MSQPARPAPAMSGAVAEANRRFEQQVNEGNAGGAAHGVYTRDARMLPPNAPAIEGRDAIAQFWITAAAQMGVRRLELVTQELTPLGDGAYEIGRADLSLVDGGHATAKYVVIWKQEGGQWRWHVDIWNMD